MEESEKRRERLRAMRAEADDAGNSRSFPAPPALSNPLTEVAAPAEPSSRFDFYTDPMSAFTRNNHAPAAAIPRTPTQFFRSPAPEMPPGGPNQQMFQPRGRGQYSFLHRGPMGGISRPSYNAYPVGPGYDYNHRLPPPRPRPFNGGGQGRGNWVNTSPRPGGGGWRGGRGGGRSSGPERFYNESMVEDPWKLLEPVLWAEAKAPSLTKSWAPSPAAVFAKKARVSDASNKVDSQSSLAEYLAASFSEAVGDAPST